MLDVVIVVIVVLITGVTNVVVFIFVVVVVVVVVFDAPAVLVIESISRASFSLPSGLRADFESQARFSVSPTQI